MSVLITVGLAFIAVILFLWWHIIDRYSYFHRRRIPFIPPKFPAGNFQTVASHEEHIVTWMRNMYLQFRGRDKLFGYYFGTATAIMITDMDTAYDILVRDFNVFPMARGPWNDPLSANLYTMEGEQWRTIRTKLSPVFSTMSTGTVLLSLQTVSEDLVNYVGQFADNPEKPVDVRDLFQRYISDALSQSILGLDTAALRDNNHPLMMIGMEMFQTRGDYDVYFLFLIVSYSHFFRKLPIRVFPSHITDYFIGIMDDAMKARVAGHDAPKNDLLDLLVRIEQAGCLTDDETGEVLGKITHNQLLGHAFMAFIMGFVTTRVTLSYAFYEMAQNPEIQERLRQEIFTALPLDQEITYDSLESIPYLQQVVDETLRKYAPGSWIERRSNADYQVRNSRHTIEKRMKILIPVVGFHNDPHVYKNPDQFNPDRMTKEKMKRRHPCSFMPFGIGHRGCMAQRVGYLYVKLGLVLLLRRFRFSLSNRTEQPVQFSTRDYDRMPDSGLWLDVHRIDGGAAGRAQEDG